MTSPKPLQHGGFYHIYNIVEEQTLRVSETLRVSKVLKPSQQYSKLFNAYAKAISKAYGRTGSLFQNPFGRKPVDSDAYFVQLVAYIHQNPHRPGIVDDFRNWTYSSCHAHLSTKPTRLKRDDVRAWFEALSQWTITST
jgi:hypothetical protein